MTLHQLLRRAKVQQQKFMRELERRKKDNDGFWWMECCTCTV